MSNHTRVFRIEHCTSELGPYHHVHKHFKECTDLFSALSLAEDKTPPLHIDRICKNHHTVDLTKEIVVCSENNLLAHFKKKHEIDMLFGFSTITQIRKWFTDKELRALHEHKFNIVVYETTRANILLFEKQAVMLRKDDAELVWKQNIISLLK